MEKQGLIEGRVARRRNRAEAEVLPAPAAGRRALVTERNQWMTVHQTADQTMEDPTSFDLNQAVALLAGEPGPVAGFHGDNLVELESHLAESVAVLQARGLSAEEAFWVATRRVGPDPQLAVEFAKVNGGAVWLDRVLWMLVGIQLWGFVSLCLAAFAPKLLALGLVGLTRF